MISVVMPLYNNARHLVAVIEPLSEALRTGGVCEVLVVDDRSEDDGPERCRQAGFDVVTVEERSGPAACRNLGAQAARGEFVLFIDSDVVMHADVPTRVRRAFAASPPYTAVFGSYDARPPASGIMSRYRNLLHHHTHQRGSSQANTFWAGCGAVRRREFLELGGFDAARYPRPAIEDIEFGYRLRRSGQTILLDKEMQCTHLKRWTLLSTIVTDVRQRALPWARLLREPGNEGFGELNVTLSERLKALVALAFWAALPLSPFHRAALLVMVGSLLIAVVVNARFYLLVRRHNGLLGALCAVVLHQFYYLYGTLAVVYVMLEGILRGRSTKAGSV